MRFPWRIVVSLVCAILSYVLGHPHLIVALRTLDNRLGKRFQWIADVRKHMATYLAWLFVTVLLYCNARFVLNLHNKTILLKIIVYIGAIPIVLVTFSARKVITNVNIFSSSIAATDREVSGAGTLF